MTENPGPLPSYSGEENDSGAVVPANVVAVTNRHFNVLSERFSQALNLHSALAGQQDAWLYRLLRDLTPLVHEAEKLLAWVVTYARDAGESEEFIARAMGRPKADLDHWRPAEAQAESKAALGQPVDNTWNVSTGEAYLQAQGTAEAAEDEQARTQALMELLLLHLTPSYEADELTWASDRVRRAVRNGWSIQIRRNQTKRATMSSCDQSSSTSTPPKPRQESNPAPSASGSTGENSPATAKTAAAEPSSTSANSKTA